MLKALPHRTPHATSTIQRNSSSESHVPCTAASSMLRSLGLSMPRPVSCAVSLCSRVVWCHAALSETTRPKTADCSSRLVQPRYAVLIRCPAAAAPPGPLLSLHCARRGPCGRIHTCMLGPTGGRRAPARRARDGHRLVPRRTSPPHGRHSGQHALSARSKRRAAACAPGGG